MAYLQFMWQRQLEEMHTSLYEKKITPSAINIPQEITDEFFSESNRYSDIIPDGHERIILLQQVVTKYWFSLDEVQILEAHSQVVASRLESRQYVYVDGSICLKWGEYIDKNARFLHYAAESSPEMACVGCTLLYSIYIDYKAEEFSTFDIKSSFEVLDIAPAHNEGRISDYYQNSASHDYHHGHRNTIHCIPSHYEDIEFILNPPNNCLQFNTYFKGCMDSTGNKIIELSEKTGLSESTISRMRNDVENKPDLKNVIACCVGMHLNPWESERLIHLAGYTLRESSKTERAYIKLIYIYYKYDVEQCNEYLSRFQIPPLTSLKND